MQFRQRFKRFFKTESLNGMIDEQTALGMLAAYQQRVEALLAQEA